MNGTEETKTKRGPNLPDRFMLRLFDVRRSVDGVEILCFRKEELQRVAEALRMIATCDPLRYARLPREIDRIIVRVLDSSRAQYSTRFMACELDTRFVQAETTSIVDLASAITHEATHGRLEKIGIKYREEQRPKIEAVCLRRELAFLRKVPEGSEKRCDEIERTLANMPSLTDESFEQRWRDGAGEALAYVGVPRLLIKPIKSLALASRRLGRRLHRRRQ